MWALRRSMRLRARQAAGAVSGTVEVQRQVRILAGNKLVFALPKGRKCRTVPLPQSVADEVSAHLTAFPPAGRAAVDHAGER